MSNCPLMWVTNHEQEKRRWQKWLAVTNITLLCVTVICYLGWMGATSTTTSSLAQQISEYRVRDEVLNILRPKGLTLSQGIDIATALVLHCKKNNIPLELGLSIIKKESQFQVQAISSASAKGLMQLLPSTYEIYNKRLNLGLAKSAIYDPIVNIMIGTLHLRDLIDENKSKSRSDADLWKRVLTAYSGGATGYPTDVLRYQREYEMVLRNGEI